MDCSLTAANLIEIASIFISLITSIVAIVISVKTLKQNSIMIEESTRPHIQIYPVFIDTILYIIIKNYGSSEAYIDSITCSHFFNSKETMSDEYTGDIFSKIKDVILSSGHSIKCPLIGYEVPSEIFDFHIKYHSSLKNYEEDFSFNPIASIPFADMTPVSRDAEEHLKQIAKELHNIVKSDL